MSVRSDLESRLNTWALSKNPVIEIAWENRPFEKPGTLFLQAVISPAPSINMTVDGRRYKEVGVFHINIWGIEGDGAGTTEELAQELITLFPVVPKWSDTSIERVGHIGQADPVNGYRVLPVTFYYRRETTLL